MSVVVEKLESCIHDFSNTNEVITNSAMSTQKDCNNRFQFAESVCQSVDGMNQTINVIVDNMTQMMNISQETTEKMKGYIELMENTTDDMQVIEQSAQHTEESIVSLETGMKEVSDFANTIAGITSQTNLLALNASIEAARAGDMGKEAESLGKLQSESSEKARLVTSSSEDTVAQGQQVLAMVQQMQDILENTLNQSNQIVQESATQRRQPRKWKFPSIRSMMYRRICCPSDKIAFPNHSAR